MPFIYQTPLPATNQRFLLVHPDFKPTRRQLFLVKLFIFVALCLPCMTTPIYWLFSSSYGKHFRASHPHTFKAARIVVVPLNVCLVPANVYWDCTLGCRFISKITQLNGTLLQTGNTTDAATATTTTTAEGATTTLLQTQVLLSLSRNTLAYIVISFVCNLALFLAYAKVIPGVALVRRRTRGKPHASGRCRMLASSTMQQKVPPVSSHIQ